MGWIRILAVVPVFLVLIASSAGAVPEWSDSAAPDTVGSYHGSDCGTPADCLESDDDSYLEARDHTIQGSTPITANRSDPLSGSDVLHDVHLRVKLVTEESSSASIRVWDGSGFTEVGSTSSNSETWVNTTVTDTIQKSNGEYPVKIVANAMAGGKLVSVDYLHLDIDHTKVGSLSYSTGNEDDSPVLGSSSIAEGDTTSVSSTTVCTGGYCGQVDSLLRANGSSIGDAAGLSLSDGNNPQTATLCDGDPATGSCSTAEMSTAWEVTGEATGTYGLDVKSTSNYSGNGVNEPESTESVLEVVGGSLATSISAGASTVLEDQRVEISGEATCQASGGCPGVSLTVQDEAGNALGSETTPFATSEANPKDCGDLSDTETCQKTWDVQATADGTADYAIQARAASTDTDIPDSASSMNVTIEAPSVSISGVAVGGSSTSLETGFDYSSNVDGTVTCTLNGADTCSAAVGSTDGSASSGSCTIDTPGYSSSNDVSCEITNSTYGVSDSATTGFDVTGSLSGTTTDRDTVNPGDTITLYCGVANTGDIRYDAGQSTKDYSSVDASIVGPDGETVETTVTDPTLEVGASSSTTESEALTVPADAAEGDWSAMCADYRLIDSTVLAAGPRETTFQVSTNQSGDLSINILSPNPRDTYYTGQGIDVVVSVEDRKGNRVTGADVIANGKRLLDDGEAADEEAGDGLYSRAMVIPDTMESYRLQVRAEKNGKSRSASSILTVQPGVTLDRIDVADTYRIGDTVTVNGTLALNRLQRNTSVTVRFISPSGNAVATRTDRNVGDGQFATSYTLGSGAETGVWEVPISVEDAYDSDSATETFEVQPPNPGAFYLNFISPDRATFRPGTAIPIELRPESSRTGNTVSLERVVCAVDGREAALHQSAALFTGNISLPQLFPPGSYTVSCTGERRYRGEVKQSTNSLSITVEPRPLELEVVKPASGVVTAGENVSVVVNVTRGGIPADNASITVLLDGRNTSTVLQQAGTPGMYRATVAVPEEAESVSFRAVDAFGNTGESDPVTVRAPGGGPDPRLFALYGVILLVSAVIIYGVYQRYLYEPPLERQAREKRRELQSVENSMQDAQRDYFNRKIDEETFREMMEKYEKEKTQLENELDEIMRELEREGN